MKELDRVIAAAITRLVGAGALSKMYIVDQIEDHCRSKRWRFIVKGLDTETLRALVKVVKLRRGAAKKRAEAKRRRSERIRLWKRIKA